MHSHRNPDPALNMIFRRYPHVITSAYSILLSEDQLAGMHRPIPVRTGKPAEGRVESSNP